MDGKERYGHAGETLGSADDEERRALREQIAALTAAVSALTMGRPGSARPSITVGKLAERYRKRTSRFALYNIAHVIEHFGDRDVSSLRRSDWLEYREKRQETNTRFDRPPKISTLNTELAQTHAMMRWAVSNEIIESNPFEGMKKLKGQRARETEIDPIELDAALVDAPVLVRVFQIACIETGMRNGSEVRRMQWTHVDWVRARIQIPAENSKTKKAREVPLTDYLKRALESMPRVLGSRFVFANPATRDPYSRGYLHSLSRRYLNRLTPAPGDERVVTHDGRHGYVSRLGRLGMSTFAAMKIAGHASAHMHFRYSHLNEDDRARAKKLLDGDRKSPQRVNDPPVDEEQKVKAGQTLTER